jgi:predicted transcriptional regulator/DNA-binding XRE family transcriptional regulator
MTQTNRSSMARQKHPSVRPSSPSELELFELLGHRLKDLRNRRGVTQVELAGTLGVGQTALSHTEDGRDMHVSRLLQYVRALGGSLEITAELDNGTRYKLLSDRTTIESAASGEDIEQLVLPGLSMSRAGPARDIVFSVKPRYAEQILSGHKTVELRRRFSTDVMTGGLAWIYSTTPTRAMTGAATISDIQRLPLEDIWRAHKKSACLAKEDFDSYFSGLDAGYAIILSTPRSLNKPLPLSELRNRFSFEPPQSYQYASPQLSGLIHDGWAEAPN